MYERFVQLLQEKNITTYRVSKDTGIHQTTFADWKSGKSSPKVDKLQIIANYFNVSLNYLLGISDDRVDDQLLDIVDEIDIDLLQKYGNVYEALKAQKQRNIVDLQPDLELIKKYHALTPQGKETVDTILNLEYSRSVKKFTLAADEDGVTEKEYPANLPDPRELFDK